MSDTIDAITLASWLRDGDELALIDVREAGQFGEGHLFFATSLPYSRLELDAGRLIPRPGTRIVAHDGGEDRLARLACERLRALGYDNVFVLAGGARAWVASGRPIYKGVNLPSKTFGELVEHVYETPRVSVAELHAMLERGDDVVVLDGRPFSEYSKMSIPTGTCCPNGELPYRVDAMVANPNTKIVVNCAGRTRSILGAQTLRNFGVPNPVFALENGTQGWYLADLPLDRGADRKYPPIAPGTDLSALQARAQALAECHGVGYVEAETVAGWIADASRSVFLCDVRTPEEVAAGSIPGAQLAPGGQLIQSTDQYVGVRNARIVVFDSDLVRAPVCASWLAQMGHEVHVLRQGAGARLNVPSGPQPRLPALRSLPPSALLPFLRSGCLLDLRASAAYRKSHVEGAVWSIRPVAAYFAAADKPIALLADDARVAQLAAIDLLDAGATDVRVVEGGLSACEVAGLAMLATPDQPADSERIDFLFFVHDRHEGNKAAARAYLEWETGLLGQLDQHERASFRLPASTHC
ncbi:MAG: sulfurtransferase [Betaproteobacteria bacterium]|nr:sulfurtransferase [Betaproteobacteria bacterium]